MLFNYLLANVERLFCVYNLAILPCRHVCNCSIADPNDSISTNTAIFSGGGGVIVFRLSKSNKTAFETTERLFRSAVRRFVDTVGRSYTQVSEHLYVGGYPGEHGLKEVSKFNYDGCLDNVQIDLVQVNLNKNVNAFGIISGCPEKVKKKAGNEKKQTTTADVIVLVSIIFRRCPVSCRSSPAAGAT